VLTSSYDGHADVMQDSCAKLYSRYYKRAYNFKLYNGFACTDSWLWWGRVLCLPKGRSLPLTSSDLSQLTCRVHCIPEGMQYSTVLYYSE